MRRIASLLLFLTTAAPLFSQTTLTVRQFENLLISSHEQQVSDAALARELASMQLSQQLSQASLDRIASSVQLGPLSEEQFELIEAASIFEPIPLEDVVSRPPPDARQQDRILQAARDYADSFAHHLPDFLAIRSTSSFNNTPIPAGGKHKVEIRMHFTGARHRQVTVRAGLEVPASQHDSDSASSDHAEGMTTRGEFGPLVATVLADAQAGSITWNRWQYGALGVRLAVFHYSVPRSASHDLISVDSSVNVLHDPRSRSSVLFRDHPAYHGDLYIDPTTGTILRITLDAELTPDAPVLSSRLAVEYAPVNIGGKTYTCPVRGIAVSVARNGEMEAIKGGSPERFVNLVRFTNYHKFGSTARIVPHD